MQEQRNSLPDNSKPQQTPDLSHGWYGDSQPSDTERRPSPPTTVPPKSPARKSLSPYAQTQPLKPSQQKAPLNPDQVQVNESWLQQLKSKLKSIQFVKPDASQTKKVMGCLLQFLLIAIFAGIILLSAGAGFAFLQYQTIKNGPDFPDVRTLKEQAAQFETTYILDREGNLLYEIVDPMAGRRTYVALKDIDPQLIAATIATEDKEFYNHPGFDPVAIARALIQNLLAHQTVSGASTITQQLARMVLLAPEERYEITYSRKAKEIVVAAELTRIYSKEEILEIYLNQINYGNLAYGVEAASQTYFKTSAEDLTFGQATFLAGLPQAPAIWNVYQNPTGAINRQSQVLTLAQELSQETGCIYVSSQHDRVCVTSADTANALLEILDYDFPPLTFAMEFPHWVFYVHNWLFENFDSNIIYNSGFTIHTSIDPVLQREAERLITEQVNSLADSQVQSGALVAIHPQTGEILAMVGSADFYNEEISGQVNMSISPRQPGSTIKPLVYLAAFEKGWTPATLLWDIPLEFSPSGMPDEFSQPYKPVNYDRKYHGPVTVRYALGNSYNIPAVSALQFVGVYQDPETLEENGFITFAQRMGISTLTRPDYGLSLALGGGEVTLLELTRSFGIMANQGRSVAPIAVTHITDRMGRTVYEAPQPAFHEIIRPEHAFLISSILSDNAARTDMFGANSTLRLPFPAAVKTGTTDDTRDAWTIGYTPELVTGVWIGNADNSEMDDITGYRGASPVWNQFMQFAIPRMTDNPSAFLPVNGVMERTICTYSGTEPSRWCSNTRPEYFAYDQGPLPEEFDFWADVRVDPWTKLLASDECDNNPEVLSVLNVKDEEAVAWIRGTNQGKAWAESIGFQEPFDILPEKQCELSDPQARAEFAFPQNGELITQEEVGIYTVATATRNFQGYTLSYGIGENPANWIELMNDNVMHDQPRLIHTLDARDLPNGPITLRLIVFSNRATKVEARVTITINVPTPTPTPTPTVTPTPTPTPTPTLTPIPIEEVAAGEA